jgi:hypothetical protein
MAALLVLSVAVLETPTAMAADHRDGPRVLVAPATLGAIDLNDLYVFVSPATSSNTVFVLSTGGAGVGILSPPFFLPGAVYEFRVSNDGDPTTDEIVYQFVFSNPDQFLRQSYTVVQQNARTGASSVLASGVTGKAVTTRGGVKVQAGLFDDPFFFDSLAFNKFKALAAEGAPLAQRIAPFLPPNIPNDFFGNFNVLAIVFEIPSLQLQSSRSNPNISVWIRSLIFNGTTYDQFDRMGRPAINTAVNFELPFVNMPNIQDLFNSVTPAVDPSLVSVAAVRINLIYGLPITQAVALAAMLLPDVTTFNTTDTNGFLNGRKLTDDVIDAELSLLTGGVLTSDRVINDSVFSNKFPYVGAPLPRAPQNAIRALQELHESGR